jgi:DNA-binding GntR family transcriptional regulator
MARQTEREDQSDVAYRALCEGIGKGRYRPGERLIETAIAAREGISRTPVRQALRRLERDGVVVFEKRRGARVRDLSGCQISDLYELRARLEAFACELAAEHATDADRAELERIAAAFEAVVNDDPARDDFVRVRATNAALHRKIATMARNPFVAMALETTIENPLVLRAYRGFTREELTRSAMFHRLIVRAICDGSGERAARLMAEHVLQARDVLVAAAADPQEKAIA